MELQAWSHDAPAKPGPPAHRVIRVGHTEHPLLDEIQHFAIQRRLESVRDMPGDLLAQENRPLTDGLIERHRLIDGRRRCHCAAHNFNERHNVRGIERMSDDAAFRMLTL
ncbi:hypothetical protein D3C72_1609670 [compost metagenome]